MVKINKDKMAEWGYSFDNVDDIFFYVSNIIEWLECHNKNYTKEQYMKIQILNEICNFLEVE